MFLTNQLQSQCDYSFHYNGDPGSEESNSIPLTAGSVLQIDYCTYYVPDELIIETPNGQLDIILGYNNISINPPYYRGFLHAFYKNNQFTYATTQGVPGDFNCQPQSECPREGMMRLIYELPEDQCDFDFHIIGNKVQSTVFDICIKILYLAPPKNIDTIETPVCFQRAITKSFENCNLIIDVPQYFGIIDEPIITNNECINEFDGSIEFPNYPEKNLYHLGPGNYLITIENEHCKKDYSINIEFNEFCKFYIPNIFSPNEDGLNDIFMFFSPVNVDYELFIYERWGGLLLKKDCISNLSGWNGRVGNRDVQPGVYIYKIISQNHLFSGDLTLTR